MLRSKEIDLHFVQGSIESCPVGEPKRTTMDYHLTLSPQALKCRCLSLIVGRLIAFLRYERL